MGAKQEKRPVTKKTHVAKIDWIPADVARALMANNYPTLGALKKGLETARSRGMLLELMKRNLSDVGDLEPLLANISRMPASSRTPQVQP